MKGATNEGEGGMGKEVSSCIEWVSKMEMELTKGNARRPCRLRSADPKLLRLGEPRSIDSHYSCGWAMLVVVSDSHA